MTLQLRYSKTRLVALRFSVSKASFLNTLFRNKGLQAVLQRTAIEVPLRRRTYTPREVVSRTHTPDPQAFVGCVTGSLAPHQASAWFPFTFLASVDISFLLLTFPCLPHQLFASPYCIQYPHANNKCITGILHASSQYAGGDTPVWYRHGHRALTKA